MGREQLLLAKDVLGQLQTSKLLKINFTQKRMTGQQFC